MYDLSIGTAKAADLFLICDLLVDTGCYRVKHYRVKTWICFNSKSTEFLNLIHRIIAYYSFVFFKNNNSESNKTGKQKLQKNINTHL